MSCEFIEPLLPDFVAKQLPAAELSCVEKHLAGCPDCRALTQQLEQLDAQLTRAIKPPCLSPTFQHKLRQRIQATPVLTPAEIAARKRQIRAEYEAGLARLSPFALPSRRWFATLRYTAALIVVSLLAWRFLPELPALLARSGFNFPGQEFLPVLIASVIFVGMGLIAAFPQRVSRLKARGR